MLSETCVCGATYDRFRTGLTFRDVKDMMWTGSENPEDWRHKRRNSVLGYWRELKLQLWAMHVGICEDAIELNQDPQDSPQRL